jgi:hypothetical protein
MPLSQGHHTVATATTTGCTSSTSSRDHYAYAANHHSTYPSVAAKRTDGSVDISHFSYLHA